MSSRTMTIVSVVIVALFVLGLVLIARAPKQAPAPEPAPDMAIVMGPYIGTLPCADCDGIDTSLMLTKRDANAAEGTYTLTESYIGKDIKTNSVSGDWTTNRGAEGLANPDATVYVLNPDMPNKSRSFVMLSPVAIQLIDASGTPVTGGTLQMSTSATGNVNLNGSTFRLSSYNGTAIPQGQNYTISFDGKRLNGRFCNSMGGDVDLADGKIKGMLVSTQMYCGEPANLMGIENSFGKALGEGATFVQRGSLIDVTAANGDWFEFSVFMD